MGLRNIIAKRDQAQNSLGQPLAGGTVFLYEPGTTTFIQAFQDSGLITPHTAPIKLSGSGRANIWINRDCDIRIEDRNGNLILTEPNANPDSLGSAPVGGFITNGGFETDSDADGVPDSWTLVNEAGSTNARDTTESTEGGASFRFTSAGTGGGNLTTTNFFPVNDVQDLRVTFDIRSTVAAVRNIVRVEWYDVTQISISDTDVYDSTANPTSFLSQSTVATPPANARFAKIKLIGIDPSVALAGSTFFDRVEAFYPVEVLGIFDNITIQNNEIITTDTDGDLNLNPDGTGEVNVNAPMNVTGPVQLLDELELFHTAPQNDDHAFEIIHDAAGFGDCKAIAIDYITGAIETGDDEGIILINIDALAATGGTVFGLEVLSTEGALDTIWGIKVGALVGPILQGSGTFANPTTGTNNTASTDVPAMIDGSEGTNTTIFVAQNDFIIIGAANAFTEIQFNIETGADNPGVTPTFAYSTAGSGQFTAFSPSDGTNGFRNTGIVSWDASDLTGHTTNDDTGTFDIKITRTHPVKGNVSLFFAKTAETVVFSWNELGDLLINDLDVTGAIFTGAITFPATQVASADANTLDDYEEGSWTPSVGGTATYTTQDGQYTKIGNRVYFSLQMNINAIGSGSQTVISGLPFTSDSTLGAAVNVGTITNCATNVVSFEARMDASATQFTVFSKTAAASGAAANVLFQDSSQCRISGHYEV